MTCACESGRVDDAALLTFPCSYEEDESALGTYGFHDLGGPSQVRCCDFERNDVDPLSDAEDVPLVRGVPERGRVAKVRLGGHEELERHVFWTGWV